MGEQGQLGLEGQSVHWEWGTCPLRTDGVCQAVWVQPSQ